MKLTYASLMSVSATSSGVSANRHVEDSRQFFEYERSLVGQTFLAPAKTASEVIEEAGLASIDLFSLDVEGAEMEVLDGLDLSRHRPKAFVIEARDPALVAAKMREHDYKLVEQVTEYDFFFTDSRVE